MYKPEDSIWAGVSGVALLLSISIPVYMYLHIQKSQSYIAEVSGQLVRVAENVRARDLTKEALQNTEKERMQLNALALKVDGAADFIDAVEAEAKVAGVDLEIGNVSATSKEGVFNELALSLKAEGSFAGLTRFLKLLETLPYASRVGSITFSKDQDASSGWVLIALVSVAQYKQ